MSATALEMLSNGGWQMNDYRILSLDGGGIRGYLTLLLLERLEKAQPGFIDQIDLFAGTSTGSIIALGLAYGLPPATLREMYETHGAGIFTNSLVHNLVDWGALRSARYSNRYLKRMLQLHFGADRLGDLDKRVLIASFDLDNRPKDATKPRMWKAKFFHNYDEEGADTCEFIVDVALRSSAAPFYFPMYQGFVDGFVVANNPSVCALTQVLKSTGYELGEISLLSLGTGLNLRYIDETDADWGVGQWMVQVDPRQRKLYALPLVYMMWEGGVNLANYQCQQLLGDRFIRLDPVLPKLVDIDDVGSMPLLKEVAEAADLTPILDWLASRPERPALAQSAVS
jgi:patatin-like phospholipase/acyl hydrolase